jgi:hypothetical protein
MAPAQALITPTRGTFDHPIKGTPLQSCERRHRRNMVQLVSTADERRAEGERRKAKPWLRLDAAFMADDKIFALGAAHGPAGPLVFLALMAAAKLQDEEGLVKMGWEQINRNCFLDDLAKTKAIIATCEEVELLELRAQNATSFTAHIASWDLYQRPADPTAAARKRRERARKVTPMSRVTNRDTHATGGLSRDDRDIDKDKDPSPPAQQVAPAVAKQNGLHPAFADVMALAQEAASKDTKVIVAAMSVDTMLRAYPHADHMQAARLAVADILAGSVKQPYFHKVLSWKLKDQPAGVAAEADHHADPHGLLERTARETAAARQARGATNTDREGTF